MSRAAMPKAGTLAMPDTTRRTVLAGIASAPLLAVPAFALARVEPDDPTIAVAAQRQAAAERFYDSISTGGNPRDAVAEAHYWQTLDEVWRIEDRLAELSPTTPAGWEAVFGVVATMHAKDDIPSYIRWGKYPVDCSCYTGHIAAPLVRRLAETAPVVLGWRAS